MRGGAVGYHPVEPTGHSHDVRDEPGDGQYPGDARRYHPDQLARHEKQYRADREVIPVRSPVTSLLAGVCGVIFTAPPLPERSCSISA